MKIRIDPIFSLIFGIVLGFWLSTFIMPYVASADYNQVISSQISIEEMSNNNQGMVFFGGLSGSLSTTTIRAFFPSGTPTFGTGIYWHQATSSEAFYNNDFAYITHPNTCNYTPLGSGVFDISCTTPINFNPNWVYHFTGFSNLVSFYRGTSVQRSGEIYMYVPTKVTGSLGSTFYQLIGTVTRDSSQVISGPTYVGSARNTRFLNANVTASTTNPKNVHFDVSYYLDPDEINRQISALNPTLVSISWSVSPSVSFSTRGFDIATTTGTSTVRFTILDSDFPDNGNIDAVVRFSNAGCVIGASDCPFPDSYLYLNFIISNKAITSSTTVENYNTLNLPIQEEVCSFSNFSGCINNSLVYLFVPDQDALNGFLDIRTQLDEVKPFGYFTRILTAVSDIDASSTQAYTMPDIPFQEAIFDPIRDTMGVILWGVFAFVFYNKRLKNIDI